MTPYTVGTTGKIKLTISLPYPAARTVYSLISSKVWGVVALKPTQVMRV